MAFVQIEDHSGQAELVIFPTAYKKIERWLDSYTVFIVKGTIDLSSTTRCKVLVNEMVPVELFFQEWKTFAGITVVYNSSEEISQTDLRTFLPAGKIPLSIQFVENGKHLKVRTTKKVSLVENNLEVLEKTCIVKITL